MRKVTRFRANSLPQLLRLVYEFKAENKPALGNPLFPESTSEGGEKPQPEAEWRSRKRASLPQPAQKFIRISFYLHNKFTPAGSISLMDQTFIGTIRPEYLEAVEAARFAARLNLWLIPLLLAAPLLVLVPLLRRCHWTAIGGLVLVTVVATWFSYYGWSETSWRTIEALAVTDAEMAETASDTDAVFEPIFLGTPFAIFYSAIWCGIAFLLRAFTRRFRKQEITIEPIAEQD